MIQHKDQRLGVFVDVQNMYYSARNLYQARLNFNTVLKEAVKGRKLIRAMAYVISADNTEEQKFFDVLYNIGFEVRQKDLQTFIGGAKKGDWDVGMSIDAIKLSSKLDVVVLVTGDGDFIPLVEYLQFTGVNVEVMGFSKTTSSKLVEAADSFVDLGDNDEKYLMDRVDRKT